MAKFNPSQFHHFSLEVFFDDCSSSKFSFGDYETAVCRYNRYKKLKKAECGILIGVYTYVYMSNVVLKSFGFTDF